MEKAGDFLLSFSVGEHLDASKVNDLIYALREKLAQPERQWVGLTKEEATEISLANRPYVIDMIAALEARLKEKNMTCPDCERNKYRAALWRAEAYKQAGHDVIERKWVGLTDEEYQTILGQLGDGGLLAFYILIESKLKEKNCG
jgi:hypothetical protein